MNFRVENLWMLFGLFGPAVLSYLTWQTAKIQSTQSATGILYVDFFTVVVGEVLAKYLLLATDGEPLPKVSRWSSYAPRKGASMRNTVVTSPPPSPPGAVSRTS